jgi:hypothetical protein
MPYEGEVMPEGRQTTLAHRWYLWTDRRNRDKTSCFTSFRCITALEPICGSSHEEAIDSALSTVCCPSWSLTVSLLERRALKADKKFPSKRASMARDATDFNQRRRLKEAGVSRFESFRETVMVAAFGRLVRGRTARSVLARIGCADVAQGCSALSGFDMVFLSGECATTLWPRYLSAE